MLGVLSVCVYHLSPTCRINNIPYLYTANYLLGYNSFYYKITQNHNNYILTEMNELFTSTLFNWSLLCHFCHRKYFHIVIFLN